MKFMISKIKYQAILSILLGFSSTYPAQELDISYHPLMEPENLATLAVIANKVSDYMDTICCGKPLTELIMGSGQSPAYLLKMMECLHKRPNREYQSVAFSGSWWDKVETDTEYPTKLPITIYIEPSIRSPKISTKIAPYDRYLKNTGLFEKLSNPTTKVLVVDFCDSGCSLQSFAHLLHTIFIANKTNLFSTFLALRSSHIKIVPMSEQGTMLEQLALSTSEYTLLYTLGSADRYNDRLVPSYPISAWDQIDPTTFQPDPNAYKVLEQIQRFATSYQPTPPLRELLTMQAQDGQVAALAK